MANCRVRIRVLHRHTSARRHLDPGWHAAYAAQQCQCRRVLPNNLVLVAGGVIGATAPTSAELDDPATRIFTVTGSLATARQRATATMLANGKVLIAGGTNTRRSIGKQVLKFQMPTHVCSDERTLR